MRAIAVSLQYQKVSLLSLAFRTRENPVFPKSGSRAEKNSGAGIPVTAARGRRHNRSSLAPQRRLSLENRKIHRIVFRVLELELELDLDHYTVARS